MERDSWSDQLSEGSPKYLVCPEGKWQSRHAMSRDSKADLVSSPDLGRGAYNLHHQKLLKSLRHFSVETPYPILIFNPSLIITLVIRKNILVRK